MCIYILNAMISNSVNQILGNIIVLILTKLHRNPEEMQRNYHAVTNFLCHF